MRNGEEIWKPIPQSNGQLEVSNHSRVRRIMTSQGKVVTPPNMVPLTVVTRGYLNIHFSVDGRQRALSLQNALLSSFVGVAPTNKHYALFVDGNRRNFDLDNLIWGRAEVRNEFRRIHATYKERPHKMIEGEICYQCIYCKEWKPRDGFYRLKGSISALGNRNTVCGIASDCKRCANQKRTERRRAKRGDPFESVHARAKE